MGDEPLIEQIVAASRRMINKYDEVKAKNDYDQKLINDSQKYLVNIKNECDDYESLIRNRNKTIEDLDDNKVTLMSEIKKLEDTKAFKT